MNTKKGCQLLNTVSFNMYALIGGYYADLLIKETNVLYIVNILDNMMQG